MTEKPRDSEEAQDKLSPEQARELIKAIEEVEKEEAERREP